MQQGIYYRPEWTCGRYNSEKRAAISYNLIEGMSYFFDDYSADIIGAILAVPRNGAISAQGISNLTNTALSSLRPFIEELCRLNLLTVDIPSQKGIANYREGVSQWRRNRSVSYEKTTEEKLPMAVTNSEMTYGERVGGVFSVMFELTYNCSEKCIHCYNIGATRNDEEQSHRADSTLLTIGDYKRIIDQLYDEGLVKVCLSGGDPFSNPLAWEIIQYLYDKEIVIDVFTNGQRIVKDVERLASFYPRTVGVSIYSSEASVHDYITRIPGSWERSMAVLNQLTELAVPLYVKCCVMRPNFKTYRGVAEIARKLGAQPQFEVNLTDSVEGDKCVSRYLRLTPEQYEIAFRDDNIPQYVGPEAPEKEEKKFPSKIVWIIFAVVAALIVFFIIGKDDEEIAVAEEALAPAVENCLSERQLINLIQLANKKQSVALTPSFAKTIEQYEEAPNVVREGGIYKPDPSPELLVEQPEQGNVLSVEILNQTYSEDGTQGEIVFEYFTQTNGYESPHRKAVALIYNEDENWRIYDFGMDATNYGNEPTYYLSGQMSDYITASNRRIQSGETFRDLNLMFSDSPEELEQMKTAVCEYAEKYDVTIPDSLTCYFYIETPTEAAK